MLCLTRYESERILLSGGIVITVVSVERGSGDRPRVRIGIDAPRDVTIHREEIWNAIASESEDKAA